MGNYTVLGLLALLLVIQLDLFAQRKNKKNPYADYWAQQEKQEQFDKVAKEAHLLFQAKKFIDAKNKYEEALKIMPDNQRAKAKVRDIELLIEKQAQAKKEPIVNDTAFVPEVITSYLPDTTQHTEVPDTLTLYLNETTQVKPRVKVDTATPVNTVQKEPEVQVKREEAKAPTAIKKTPAKKQVVNAQPYKNSENYRKYLATLYEAGWTEEQYTEGNKEITKRVYVKEKYGDEYLLVKHHYGAKYYFKNGESISYATWVAETEKTKH